MRDAIKAAGSKAALGRLLGVSRQAVHQWHHCPMKHVIAIERATGVPRERLRPDLYRTAELSNPWKE